MSACLVRLGPSVLRPSLAPLWLVSWLLAAGCGAESADDPAGSISVVSITPGANTVDVALDTTIRLELSAAPREPFKVSLTAAGGEIAHAMRIEGTTVTLTPSSPLWIATGYQVAIPESAGLARAFASSFVTRDGAWKPAQLSSRASATPGGSAAPTLAVVEDGSVLVSWASDNALVNQRFSPGAGWNKLVLPVTLNGDDTFVDTAAASTTQAVAAHRYTLLGGSGSIDARTYNGSVWSAPVVVSDDRVGNTTFEQFLGGVASTPQAHAVSFHRGTFAAGYDLYASLRAGSTWSAPILIEPLAGSATSSRIAADGRGGFVLLWTQRDAAGSSTAVWYSTLSAQGVVGTPQKLDDGPNDAFGVAMARAGERVWMAWGHRETESVGSRIVVRSLAADGLGAAKSFVVPGQLSPQLALAASASGAFVAWSHQGAITGAIYAAAAWSAPQVIAAASSDPADNVGRPALALDDRGNATATWTRIPKLNGRRSTMAARWHASRWSTTTLDDQTRSTRAWSAGVDPQGRVTVLWTDDGAPGYRVWAARLE